jgi:hypothetical protein
VDPGIGSTIACGELKLGGECWVSSVELISPTSTMYVKNVGFIREVIH